jgi:hypothetical protein
MNPTGGSLAVGHPFGATGARILSQAVKELAARPKGEKAIVSICADGGQGTMMLLESLLPLGVGEAGVEARRPLTRRQLRGSPIGF